MTLILLLVVIAVQVVLWKDVRRLNSGPPPPDDPTELERRLRDLEHAERLRTQRESETRR